MFRLLTQPNPAGGANLTSPTISPPLAGGAWTWFIDPRGIRVNDTTYFGQVNRNGDIGVSSFKDGGPINQSFILKSAMEADDHDNPSFLCRSGDSRIMAFYSPHGASVMYQRISTNAEDISAWGTEVNIGASFGASEITYPNPVQLNGEAGSPLYLFYRDRTTTCATWSYTKSTNSGVTWGPKTSILTQDTSTYFRLDTDSRNRIDIGFSTHPNYDPAKKINHMYYSSGSWYKTDGTQIVTTFPLAASNATEVFDSGSNLCWIWDTAKDTNGNLAIVFAVYPTASDHRYYYARWSGTAWSANQITTGGSYIFATENHYSGGIILDHSDINNVYLAKQNGTEAYQIHKYVTTDSGNTWTSQQITNTPTILNVRPVVIRNYSQYDKVLWFSGRYESYVDFGTQIYSSNI